MEDKAEYFLRKALNGQKKAYGKADNGTVYNLLYFYISQEQYLEAETLLQETLDGDSINQTSKENRNATWYHMATSLQGELALLKSPGVDYYWEDSRIYLDPSFDITLTPAFPLDPFPQKPCKIAVRAKELEMMISQEAFEDSPEGQSGQSLELLADRIRRTKVWRLLEAKAKEGDWSVFQNDEDLVGYDQEFFESRHHNPNWPPDATRQQMRASRKKPFNLWMFLGEQEEVEDSSGNVSISILVLVVLAVYLLKTFSHVF